jgi:hypothetical protein
MDDSPYPKLPIQTFAAFDRDGERARTGSAKEPPGINQAIKYRRAERPTHMMVPLRPIETCPAYMLSSAHPCTLRGC